MQRQKMQSFTSVDDCISGINTPTRNKLIQKRRQRTKSQKAPGIDIFKSHSNPSEDPIWEQRDNEPKSFGRSLSKWVNWKGCCGCWCPITDQQSNHGIAQHRSDCKRQSKNASTWQMSRKSKGRMRKTGKTNERISWFSMTWWRR